MAPNSTIDARSPFTTGARCPDFNGQATAGGGFIGSHAFAPLAALGAIDPECNRHGEIVGPCQESGACPDGMKIRPAGINLFHQHQRDDDGMAHHCFALVAPWRRRCLAA